MAEGVLKFFAPLDEFITVLVLSDEDVEELFRDAKLESADDYIHLLLTFAVPNYLSEIYPAIVNIYGDDSSEIEDALYEIVTDVNPHVDIEEISVPVSIESRPAVIIDGKNVNAGAEVGSRTTLAVDGLRERLRSRIVGQERAIDAVCETLTVAAAGLHDPDRPLGVFFFAGQTGVGKTFFSRELSKALFDSEPVVVDCSEFQERHTVARLGGAPPGYVGYEDGGFLEKEVRERKRCLVLFDEVEKAHPALHRQILHVMDRGVMRDGKGREVDFRNCVICMTSNVGQREVQELYDRMGFASERDRSVDGESATARAMRDYFDPEFINRIDAFVYFEPLDREKSEKICSIMFAEIAERMKKNRGIDVEFTDAAVSLVADRGTSRRYGARSLRRVVTKEVTLPLSDAILRGAVGERVLVDAVDGKITLR